MAEQGNNNMMIIVIIGVLLICVMSSMFGVFGVTQGWIKFPGTTTTETTLYTTSPPTADSTSSDTSGSDYEISQGIPAMCAMSKQDQLDQYNSAVPPFDPSKCQDVTLERNCILWTSMDAGDGKQFRWVKGSPLTGCIPAQPDTIGLAKGTKYFTEVGEVDLGDVEAKEPGQQRGGGYGKYGDWRNARDSKNIIAMAMSGKLRAKRGKTTRGGKPILTGAGRTARRTTTARTPYRRANAPPAPVMAPAYADSAPYQQGLVSYSII